MAKIEGRPTVEMSVSLVLSEVEARALHALTEYGTKQFVEMFYREMGRSALEPYQSGLVSLFDTMRNDVEPLLKRAADARGMFVNAGFRSPSDHPNSVNS